MTGSLTGTRLLLGLGLRRDRVPAGVWVGVLLAMSVASAAATPVLYKHEADIVKAAATLNGSKAIVALYGPILDPTSKGEVSMTKMTVLYSVFVAVLFVVLVRRHTRVEEETGRTELVGGTSVGRDAPLAAALFESLIWAALLCALVALGNMAFGLGVTGSVAFGLMWFGIALLGMGIGALTAQLAASARTCASWAAAILGVLYVVRAAGDIGPDWLAWCSPFGWNTRFRAYSDPRWWLLLAYAAVAAVLVFAAVLLRARRDMGSGLLAARPGPAYGSTRLRDAFSLVLRLQGTTLVLWTVAVAVCGVLFGAIVPSLNDILDSVAAQNVIDTLGGALISAILSIVAVIIGYFAVTVVVHAAGDETGGRAEMVLATATSRSRWFLASVSIGLLGILWLLLVMGVGLWVGYATGSAPPIHHLVLAAVAWAPAAWVVAALGVVAMSLRPSYAVAAWAWPVVFLVYGILAESYKAPTWVLRASPYHYVPELPDAWAWGPQSGLTVVAAGLLAAAWWRFRTRDIG